MKNELSFRGGGGRGCVSCFFSQDLRPEGITGAWRWGGRSSEGVDGAQGDSMLLVALLRP